MEMSDAVFRSGGEHLHLAVSEIPDKLHLYPILTLQGYLGSVLTHSMQLPGIHSCIIPI